MASTYYSNLNTLQKIQLKKFEFEYPNRKLSANIYSRKCDVSTSTFNPPQDSHIFYSQSTLKGQPETLNFLSSENIKIRIQQITRTMSANEYLISKIKYSKNKYSANGFSTSCIKLRDVNTPFSSLPVISKDTKRKLKKIAKQKINKIKWTMESYLMYQKEQII